MTRMPRLLIGGTHSGAGKTTVAAGLARAFVKRGLRVQPFKAGPDYIDPGHLTLASGRRCRNLDAWMVPDRRMGALFEQGCREADLGIIEGVMGLYDGLDALSGRGSSAQLARRLRCPILLVIDAQAVSRSAAAVVKGFSEFEPDLRVAGCFVNRVAGESHFRLVKGAVERLAGVPVVGWLARGTEWAVPERHLGLVPVQENGSGAERRLDRLAAQMARTADLDRIWRIARSAPVLRAVQKGSGTFWTLGSDPAGRATDLTGLTPRKEFAHSVRIGIAQDEAFHFYYPENLELLEQLGAECVPFRPLKERRLPAGLGALYLGGGFPEGFAGALSRNRSLHREIRERAAAGMPVYAECGGLMFLSRGIRDSGGRRHPMVGLVPAEVRMTDRLQRFGYKRLRAARGTLLARVGETARGHEFHHSLARGIPSAATAAYRAAGVSGNGWVWEGYAAGNLLASYVHLHFWSCPRWAARFVAAAWRWKTDSRQP